MQTNSNQGQGSNQNSGNQQNGQPKPTLSWSQPVTTNTNGGNKQPQPQNTQPRTSLPTTPATATSSNTPWIIAGVVIVIALIVWGFNSGRKGSDEAAGTATTTDSTELTDTSSTTPTGTTAGISTTTTAQGSSTGTPVTASAITGLTISSPQDSGLQVAVADVEVTSPTWVVVYEDTNNVPGNVLGAGLFTSDRKSGVVELLRGTLPGQTYFIGESRDDGDHMYSMTNDPATRDASGNPELTTFQTK